MRKSLSIYSHAVAVLTVPPTSIFIISPLKIAHVSRSNNMKQRRRRRRRRVNERLFDKILIEATFDATWTRNTTHHSWNWNENALCCIRDMRKGWKLHSTSSWSHNHYQSRGVLTHFRVSIAALKRPACSWEWRAENLEQRNGTLISSKFLNNMKSLAANQRGKW